MTPRAAIAVAVIGVLTYGVSLGGGFVLDDHTAVEASACVTGALDLGAIFGRNYWCQPQVAQTIDTWRPVPVLAWWVAWQIGGGAAWPFHVLNVVLHAATAVGVGALAVRWFPSAPRAGWWAAAAFATLPIHAEAVASIVGVAEVWALGFSVGALLLASVATSRASRREGWWLAAGGCLVLALLSKESAVVTAVMLVVLAWWSPSKLELRERMGVAVGTAIVVGGYLLVRADVLGTWMGTHVTATVNPLVDAPIWMRGPMALTLLGRYVVLSVVGYPLSADYSVEQIPVEAVSPWMLAGLATVVGGIWLFRRRRDDLGIRHALVWLVGAATLAVNVVALLPAIFAERLFYAPSAPLCLLIGVGLDRLVADRGRRGVVLGAVVVGLWGVAAAQHALAWTTEDRITEVTALHSPQSGRAHLWRARVLGRLGDAEGMRRHAEEATRILPEVASARALLAASMDATGQPEAALPLFRSAMEQDPASAEVADLFIQFLLRYGHGDPAQLVYARHVEANGGVAAPSVTRP